MVIDFVRSNWLDLGLLLVGFFAFVVYLLQKRDEKKAAATKVILQIDHIENIISELKSKHSLDNITIYKIPIILENDRWEECGYLLYRNISGCDIKLVDDFFSCAAELEKSRAAICHSMLVAWEHKDAEVQAKIAESINCNDGERKKVEDSISLFESCDHIFTGGLPIKIIENNLSNIRYLSGTTAYKKLQKISYRK